MDTTTVHHPTTREQRGLALYRERGHLIEEVAPGFYLVPSLTSPGERYYHVDYRDETCDCPDHEHRGATCLHIYAVGVKLAKRRSKRIVCSGCGGFPMSGLVEVGPEHAAHGHGVREGERYCRPCARRAGVQ